MNFSNNLCFYLNFLDGTMKLYVNKKFILMAVIPELAAATLFGMTAPTTQIPQVIYYNCQKKHSLDLTTINPTTDTNLII